MIADKIGLIEYRAIKTAPHLRQFANPLLRRLKRIGPGFGTDDQPINCGLAGNMRKKRLARNKCNILFLYQDVVCHIKHLLIGCRSSKPGIFRKTKFKISDWIFGQKLENMLRAFRDNIYNIFYPIFGNPIAEKICHAANENLLTFYYFGGLEKPIGMERRFETSTESVVHGTGITIWTSAKAARHWIPRHVRPFDFSLIHPYLFGKDYSTILNFWQQKKWLKVRKW